jgi:glyoxylase-like metal-dependent hydrolase (beta-lactamase superfamily II)
MSTAGDQDDQLPDFVPLLPHIKAREWPVDRQRGYLVREIKPATFVITDGGYQALFAATGAGVVLFDAPPSCAPHLTQAIGEVTAEPIAKLVYSHGHVDHIGGAGLIRQQNPDIEIIAEQGVAQFLRDQDDPNRPMPARTFKEREVLTFGTLTADLRLGHWHSPPGDLFIHLPDKQVLMAVDTMSSGWVPFMGLDLTMNMHAYLKVFAQMLAYDFNVLVPGHHSNASTRQDVQLVADYVADVYQTVKRINESDHRPLQALAAQKYSRDNSYAITRVVIDRKVAQAAKEIKSRWIGELVGVDVWAESHCRTALIYCEWDVGARPAANPVRATHSAGSAAPLD